MYGEEDYVFNLIQNIIQKTTYSTNVDSALTRDTS